MNKGKSSQKKTEAPKVLSFKERLFADRYIINKGNGQEAAEYAGYSPHTARVKASQLLIKPHISNYISASADVVFDEYKIDKDRVLREYARLGFSDIRKYYQADGQLKNITDLDDDAAAALASVEVDELYDGKGDDRKVIGYVKKIKLHGKRDALDSICKIKGWNAPGQLELSGEIQIGYGEEE